MPRYGFSAFNQARSGSHSPVSFKMRTESPNAPCPGNTSRSMLSKSAGFVTRFACASDGIEGIQHAAQVSCAIIEHSEFHQFD
jgi:hypothetical protein